MRLARLAVAAAVFAGTRALGAEGPEGALRGMIIRAVEKGSRPRAWIDMFGRPLRGRVRAADGEGLKAEVLGREVEVPWSALKPARLLRLAESCAEEKGEAYMTLARYAWQSDLKERAAALARRAVELDPRLREKAAGMDPSLKDLARPRAPVGRLRRLTVGRPAPRPEWAGAELEFLEANDRAYDAFLHQFYDGPRPYRGIAKYGGCDDDKAEGIAIFDRYILLRGSRRLREAYVRIWKNIFQERRMPETNKIWCTGGFDPEHTSELFQLLWGAIEVAPTDVELIAHNLRLTDFVIDDFYDPETRLLKSARILKLGGKYRSLGDVVIQTVYINGGLLAYLTTGREKYRKWVLDYGTSWNELAEENGGVFPFYVPPGTRSVPEVWWKAPFYDFDYVKWGLVISARGFHSLPLALCLLDGGNPGHASGVKSTAFGMFTGRSDGLPNCKYDGKRWVRGGAAWCVPRLLDHAYITTWDAEVAARLKSYYAAAGKHGAGGEEEVLRFMSFIYFGTDDLSYPTGVFRWAKAKLEDQTARIRRGRVPRSGDELRRYSPTRAGLRFLDGAFWGLWDNQRCGGASPSSIRYFQADGSAGLPKGVAVIVRHVAERGLRVLFYNDNPTQASLVLTGGAYGQHRIDGVAADGGDARADVADRRVRITLRPKSLTALTVHITRYAYEPTLRPQFDDEGGM